MFWQQFRWGGQRRPHTVGKLAFWLISSKTHPFRGALNPLLVGDKREFITTDWGNKKNLKKSYTNVIRQKNFRFSLKKRCFPDVILLGE
jgi:hypothetical protein